MDKMMKIGGGILAGLLLGAAAVGISLLPFLHLQEKRKLLENWQN